MLWEVFYHCSAIDNDFFYTCVTGYNMILPVLHIHIDTYMNRCKHDINRTPLRVGRVYYSKENAQCARDGVKISKHEAMFFDKLKNCVINGFTGNITIHSAHLGNVKYVYCDEYVVNDDNYILHIDARHVKIQAICQFDTLITQEIILSVDAFQIHIPHLIQIIDDHFHQLDVSLNVDYLTLKSLNYHTIYLRDIPKFVKALNLINSMFHVHFNIIRHVPTFSHDAKYFYLQSTPYRKRVELMNFPATMTWIGKRNAKKNRITW